MLKIDAGVEKLNYPSCAKSTYSDMPKHIMTQAQENPYTMTPKIVTPNTYEAKVTNCGTNEVCNFVRCSMGRLELIHVSLIHDGSGLGLGI